MSGTALLVPEGAWLVLAVVFIADVMDAIDASIATLAGPSSRADRGGRETTPAFDRVAEAIRQAAHAPANGSAPQHHATRKEHA